MVSKDSAKYWKDKYLKLKRKFEQSKGRPRLKGGDESNLLIWSEIQRRHEDGKNVWDSCKDFQNSDELKEIRELYNRRPFTNIQSLKDIHYKFKKKYNCSSAFRPIHKEKHI